MTIEIWSIERRASLTKDSSMGSSASVTASLQRLPDGASLSCQPALRRSDRRGDALGELVERRAPAGLRVLASGRVRAVAEDHARPVAVGMELDAQDRRLVHARHRIGAHDEQLGLDQLEDLVSDRKLGAAVAHDHRQLVAAADAQVDADLVLWRREVLSRAVPGGDLVGIGPRLEHALARRVEGAGDEDLVRGGHGVLLRWASSRSI